MIGVDYLSMFVGSTIFGPIEGLALPNKIRSTGKKEVAIVRPTNW
jgi:hypothetical protein